MKKAELLALNAGFVIGIARGRREQGGVADRRETRTAKTSRVTSPSSSSPRGTCAALTDLKLHLGRSRRKKQETFHEKRREQLGNLKTLVVMSQSQPLRIENPNVGSLGTTKTINSRLWFVNNRPLEERILGYLAKYREKHEVVLYAFVLQGNHSHITAQFPQCNRAAFYRDLNARTAEAVRKEVQNFPGGPLFARRYCEQALPTDLDIENYFFYCALQPVKACLCPRIGDYPGYNSFHDAISGIERKFKVIDWTKFNAERRYNPKARRESYTTVYTLKYARLPGYEDLSQRDYKKLMLKKLELRRQALLKELKLKGATFLGVEKLLQVRPGQLPRKTKKTEPGERSPIVASVVKDAKEEYRASYFTTFDQYKEASARYLAGEEDVVFPEGTYKPPGPFVPLSNAQK